MKYEPLHRQLTSKFYYLGLGMRMVARSIFVYSMCVLLELVYSLTHSLTPFLTYNLHMFIKLINHTN
jgi:hypothetical protein